MGQMNRISKTGLNLIKGFEGFRRRSEALSGGGWIVGFGHTKSAREGVEVTEREAEYLLRYDLQDVESMVSSAVHAPLNQNEFDALVSFAWNVGRENFHVSDVLKYVNGGEMLAAAESFNAWRKARVDGRLIVVDALVRRRAAEKHLFLSHPSGAPRAPSQIVRPELDVAASVLALSDGALSIETKINGDGTIQRTVREDVSSRANEEQSGLVMPLAGPSVEQTSAELTDYEDTASEEETVENAALVDLPEDAEGPSIWDATDEVEGEFEPEYDDLDDAELDEEDDEDDQSNVDDSLLAAAVIASNLSRRDDESDSFPAEGDEDDDAELVSAFADLEDDDQTIEKGLVEEIDVTETVEVTETTEVVDVEAVEIVESDDSQDETETADEADIIVLPESFETPAENEASVEVETEAVEFVTELDENETEPQAVKVQEFLSAEAQDEDFSPVDDAGIERGDPSDVWHSGDDEIEAEQARKKCIVDPNVAEHFPDEMAAMDEGYSPVAGGRRSGADVWISLVPFIILVVLGAVMCVFGIFDWWGLVSSDTPVDQNELYAGPFLTLIGGLGFLFGIYFIVRKMMGVED